MGRHGYQYAIDAILLYGILNYYYCDLQEKKAHYQKLKEMLDAYDEDKSGDLDASELKKFLERYGEGSMVAGRKTNATPTSEEVEWILQAVNKSKNLGVKQIEIALDLWHSYVTNRNEIEPSP